MQAKKAPSEDATIEIGAKFAFDETSDGCSLLACAGEERLEVLSDNFVEECLLRLVALVVGHVDPVRDRAGVRGKCSRSRRVATWALAQSHRRLRDTIRKELAIAPSGTALRGSSSDRPTNPFPGTALA